MKKATRVRMLVATATATVVLAGAGVGAAYALGNDESEQQPPAARHGVVESQSPNPWLANDCALLLRTVPQDVLIGC